MGTAKLNRVPNAEMPTGNDLQKLELDAMVKKVSTVDKVKLSLVSWSNNKVVSFFLHL